MGYKCSKELNKADNLFQCFYLSHKGPILNLHILLDSCCVCFLILYKLASWDKKIVKTHSSILLLGRLLKCSFTKLLLAICG